MNLLEREWKHELTVYADDHDQVWLNFAMSENPQQLLDMLLKAAQIVAVNARLTINIHPAVQVNGNR